MQILHAFPHGLLSCCTTTAYGTSAALTPHATTHEQPGIDPITGERLSIAYTPNNYTRSTAANLSTNIYQLGANIEGIDNRLGDLLVLISSIVGGMTFQGEVATYAALTAVVGPSTGDVYVVQADETQGGIRTHYVYDGASWVYLGPYLNSYIHPNHTGDINSLGDGACTITADAVDNSKLDNMPALTLKGNDGTASADPQDLSISEVQAMLDIDMLVDSMHAELHDINDTADHMSSYMTSAGSLWSVSSDGLFLPSGYAPSDFALATDTEHAIDSTTIHTAVRDITDFNVSLTAHGFLTKAPNDSGQYFAGDAVWRTLPEAVGDHALDDTSVHTALRDIDSFNVSATSHGFTPKLPNDTSQFLDGSGQWVEIDSAIIHPHDSTTVHSAVRDITDFDFSTDFHGYAPKAPADSTQYLAGDAAWHTIPSADQHALDSTTIHTAVSDITDFNVSLTAHGFVVKAPNDSDQYFAGDAVWHNLPNVDDIHALDSTTIHSALSDTTDFNVSVSAHGLTPKAPNDSEQFFGGDAEWHNFSDMITDVTPHAIDSTTAHLSASDITDHDVSTDFHGLIPKLPDDEQQFFDGEGEWVNPVWKDFESSFSRASDSTFTVTDNSDNQAIFTTGRAIRYRATAGTWQYGQVTAYSAGTVTLCGAPMTGSHDDELAYDFTGDSVVQFDIGPVHGTFASGADNTLLDDRDIWIEWRQGKAYLVRISHRVGVDDSGGSQPNVNVSIGGNKVCTANSNEGRAVSESWVDTVVDLNNSNYDIAFGDAIEVTTDAAGTNNDALNLYVSLTFVLERS
jgi:hypothetical protein